MFFSLKSSKPESSWSLPPPGCRAAPPRPSPGRQSPGGGHFGAAAGRPHSRGVKMAARALQNWGKTHLCVKQRPSHSVSLQETERGQQLMHLLQQTMQLLRTQKTEEAASQFCNTMPMTPHLQYRLGAHPDPRQLEVHAAY